MSPNLNQYVAETIHVDAHIMDLVIAKLDESCIRSLSLSSIFTDHDAMHIDINICKPRQPQRTIIYGRLKDIDSKMLSSDINESEPIRNSSTTLV